MSREIPQTNRVVLINTLAFQTRGLVLDRGRRSGLVYGHEPPNTRGEKNNQIHAAYNRSKATWLDEFSTRTRMPPSTIFPFSITLTERNVTPHFSAIASGVFLAYHTRPLSSVSSHPTLRRRFSVFRGVSPKKKRSRENC